MIAAPRAKLVKARTSCRDGISSFLDGHLRDLAYFPRRLDDDALREVTV